MKTPIIQNVPTKIVGSSAGFGALRVELPDIGLGTQRTSGTYIALLLSLEDRSDVAGILLDVLDHLKITPEKLIEYRAWYDAGGTINDTDAPKI